MKTILIVDDEPAARYGLRRALESKYRIAEADSAETARQALPREQNELWFPFRSSVAHHMAKPRHWQRQRVQVDLCR